MTLFSNQPCDIEHLPKLAEIKFQPLDPRYPLVRTLEQFMVQTVLIFIASLIIYKTMDQALQLWLYSGLVILSILTLIWTYHSAKFCGYALREQDILFRKGLLIQRTTAVSFNRVQHIDLTHGPLQRRWRMATVKFFTAGGQSADLQIPGLPETNATAIRDMILGKINSQVITQPSANIE